MGSRLPVRLSRIGRRNHFNRIKRLGHFPQPEQRVRDLF